MGLKKSGYLIDTLQCVYAIMFAILYVAFFVVLIVAIRVKEDLNFFTILIIVFEIVFETFVLMNRFRLSQFNKVLFSDDGISVFFIKNRIAHLSWDKVQEVGIKYWSGKDEHDRLRNGGQYIYFADHFLDEKERSIVGSYHQAGLLKKGVIFFCCFDYLLDKHSYDGACMELKVSSYFPEGFFDIAQLCDVCKIKEPYQGIECAYVNRHGIVTCTKQQFDSLARSEIRYSNICLISTVIAVLAIMSPLAVLFV